MIIDKFNGPEDEDYDVWWEDLKAFFNLYDLSENETNSFIQCTFRGEARKFLNF